MDVVEPADDEGRESTSSRVLAGGMFAYEEDGSDMIRCLPGSYASLRVSMADG